MSIRCEIWRALSKIAFISIVALFCARQAAAAAASASDAPLLENSEKRHCLRLTAPSGCAVMFYQQRITTQAKALVAQHAQHQRWRQKRAGQASYQPGI